METYWLVSLPILFADEQRPVLPPGVKLAGVSAPLLKALPLAGVVQSFATTVS